MVVSACRNECRLRAETLREFKAEHTAIERQCAVDIGNFQMDVADADAGGRVVSVLEGGYDLEGLARSAAAHVMTLMRG